MAIMLFLLNGQSLAEELEVTRFVAQTRSRHRAARLRTPWPCCECAACAFSAGGCSRATAGFISRHVDTWQVVSCGHCDGGSWKHEDAHCRSGVLRLQGCLPERSSCVDVCGLGDGRRPGAVAPVDPVDVQQLREVGAARRGSGWNASGPPNEREHLRVGCGPAHTPVACALLVGRITVGSCADDIAIVFADMLVDLAVVVGDFVAWEAGSALASASVSVCSLLVPLWASSDVQVGEWLTLAFPRFTDFQ